MQHFDVLFCNRLALWWLWSMYFDPCDTENRKRANTITHECAYFDMFCNVWVDVSVTAPVRQSLETASLYMKTSKTSTFGKHCPLDFLLPLCFSPHVPISSNSAEVSGSNCLARVFFGVCHTGALRADAVLACHLLTLLRIPWTLGSGWLSEAVETMLVITSQALIVLSSLCCCGGWTAAPSVAQLHCPNSILK